MTMQVHLDRKDSICNILYHSPGVFEIEELASTFPCLVLVLILEIQQMEIHANCLEMLLCARGLMLQLIDHAFVERCGPNTATRRHHKF